MSNNNLSVGEVSGELNQLAKAQKAVAAALKAVSGIVKGYLASFDELQRVSVKKPSGGSSSSKKTAQETQQTLADAQMLESVLDSLEPKVQSVMEGIRNALDPMQRFSLSSVDGELNLLAQKSATVGGAMAGALTVVAGKYHDIINTINAATTSSDAAAGKVENRWASLAQHLKEQTILPLDGGFKGLGEGITAYMGGAIDAVTASVKAVTAAVSAINNLKITLPSGIPLGGGKTFSLSVPGLAKGAVLPANQPFLAMVGDQKSGKNVEAPLATIQEAVAQVMDGYAMADLAGHEATVGVLKEILEAVLGIEVGDSVIGAAAQRYNSKMAVVRGL